MFRLKGSERETGSGKDGKQGKEIKNTSLDCFCFDFLTFYSSDLLTTQRQGTIQIGAAYQMLCIGISIQYSV